ncbi:MAG: DegT/DnrJ/EryC1/StrS family aminotransferase [Spirochaetes bacterium]|nr:DegT/DnrJ/EryC1/StrS family aminotransferase [Spirochaetota bacterium]
MKIEAYSPTIKRKEMDAVLTAMVEDKIGPGERSRLLIQTAKEQLGFEYALALRSPATALHFALKALGLQQGQAVVVSALSPLYYFHVINDLGLKPLFADVPDGNPCMSVATIENAISQKDEGTDVRAIVLHHTLGFLPDAAAITQLGLLVIEDISQSYGTYTEEAEGNAGDDSGEEGEKPGAQSVSHNVAQDAARSAKHYALHGTFAILGLEERDMLTSGGGALLFAMNRRDAGVLRNLAAGAAPIPNEYCLADINAALAVVQFKEFPKNIQRRAEIAAGYNQSSLSGRHKRFVPIQSGFAYNNYAFPLVLETGQKDVAAYARKKEIIIENAFEQSLAGAGITQAEQCPVAHSYALRTVLFPLYPRLRAAEAQRVSKLIGTLP